VAAGSKLASNISEPTLNLSHIKNSYKTFEYNVAKGAIVDVSWSGMVLCLSFPLLAPVRPSFCPSVPSVSISPTVRLPHNFPLLLACTCRRRAVGER
jgi:hypothetical protein